MLTKTLKKDLLELARSHGLKVTARMTKQQIMEVYYVSAKKAELFALARLLGYRVNSSHTKNQLLNLCMPVNEMPERSASGLNLPHHGERLDTERANALTTPKAHWLTEPHIELPWRYHENRLVLLPVNPNKVYGYWEVVSEIEISGKLYRTADCKLVLNLFASAENSAPFILQTVEVCNFGEYYFDHYMAGQTVWLELGIKDHGFETPVVVMASLKKQMPNDHISEDRSELYLTVLNYDSDKPVLVFSGQGDARGEEIDDIFKGDLTPFPRFGY